MTEVVDEEAYAAGLEALTELSEKSLGSGVWVAIGLYLAALLATAIVPFVREKRWQRVEDTDGQSARNHFIAGGNLGLFVVPLTLFATLFSGISLVGIPSEAFINGMYTLRWTLSLVPFAVGFACLAPRMRRWSDYRGGYITGVDVVSDRFRDSGIRVLVACVQIFAAFLYVLAQLVAIGATIESLSGGTISRVAAAGALAVIMLIYEGVGGMRSVAWTDVIQGIVLFVGFVFIFVVQDSEFGGVDGATAFLRETPYSPLVAPTSLRAQGLVLPFLLSFFPFVLYGHMQQRIFAASSERTIKMGSVILTIISLFITIGACFTGVLAKAHFLELFGFDTVHLVLDEAPDNTFGLLMRVLMVSGDTVETSTNYIFGSLILAASVAALMSTADSALLSLSSALCMDIIQPYFWKESTAEQLVWLGRLVSLVTTGLAIAASSTDPDLVGLLLTQQQYLMQLVPVFIAAMFIKRARARPMFFGILAGVIVNTVMVYSSSAINGAGTDRAVDQSASAGTAGLIFTIFFSVALHYVDTPWMSETWGSGSWERFGEPLPEEYIGYRVPGWSHELIHAPYCYGYFVIIFVAFFFGFSWFYEPGVVVVIGDGFPAFAAQQLFLFASISVFLAFLTYVGWGTDHEVPIVAAKELDSSDEELSKTNSVDDSMAVGDSGEYSSEATPRKSGAGEEEMEMADVTPLAVDVSV